AYSVSDERHECETFAALEYAWVGEARVVDVHATLQRADQEMIFVVLPDLARTREPVDVQLIVVRAASNTCGHRLELIGHELRGRDCMCCLTAVGTSAPLFAAR